MNKNLPLYIYGSTIIFSGLFLLFSDNGIFEVIKFNMGIDCLHCRGLLCAYNGPVAPKKTSSICLP